MGVTGNTMTYENYINTFNICMIIFCVTALVAVIAIAIPTVRKKLSTVLFLIFFVWGLGMVILNMTFPEHAGIKECGNVVGTLTLQDEYGTRTDIISNRYCRYLMNDGWSDWRISNVRN